MASKGLKVVEGGLAMACGILTFTIAARYLQDLFLVKYLTVFLGGFGFVTGLRRMVESVEP